MTNVADTTMLDTTDTPADTPEPAPSRVAKPVALSATDVKAILKAELKRRGLTYADLVERLAQQGVTETEANLRNKISRGAFTATFFMQCLIAAGCEAVQITPPRRD
jgi:hypothetical protein